METFRPAFTEPPGTNLAGIPVTNLRLVNPDISYGLPFYDACAKHISETFKASRVYIVASRSLAANTDNVDKLVTAIGDKVAGVRNGITPHTPWSEVLQITKECREKDVDCVVTLGAGSITDGCKLVVLVSYFPVEKRAFSLMLYLDRLSRTVSGHPSNSHVTLWRVRAYQRMSKSRQCRSLPSQRHYLEARYDRPSVWRLSNVN